MKNIFSTISEDAVPAMKSLKLTLVQVRERRGTRVDMLKRSMLFSYLNKVCGYNYSEIAFYTHKEHSTVRTNILTHTKLWEENKDELLQNMKEI